MLDNRFGLLLLMVENRSGLYGPPRPESGFGLFFSPNFTTIAVSPERFGKFIRENPLALYRILLGCLGQIFQASPLPFNSIPCARVFPSHETCHESSACLPSKFGVVPPLLQG